MKFLERFPLITYSLVILIKFSNLTKSTLPLKGQSLVNLIASSEYISSTLPPHN